MSKSKEIQTLVRAIDSTPPPVLQTGVLIALGALAFVLAYLLCRTYWGKGLMTGRGYAKKTRRGLIVFGFLSVVICLLIGLIFTGRI